MMRIQIVGLSKVIKSRERENMKRKWDCSSSELGCAGVAINRNPGSSCENRDPLVRWLEDTQTVTAAYVSLSVLQTYVISILKLWNSDIQNLFADNFKKFKFWIPSDFKHQCFINLWLSLRFKYFSYRWSNMKHVTTYEKSNKKENKYIRFPNMKA